jgi:hypothetical protein
MASTACALERHRITHGTYPELLQQIDPAIMPTPPLDLFATKPFHYKLLSDGRFQLYSIGPNMKDDGGTIVITKTEGVDTDQGDWVWEYPAEKP